MLTEDHRRAFFVKLKRDGECLVWPRSPSRRGYSCYAIRSQRFGGPYRTTTGAHRVAFELEYGPIPKGLHVIHSCDNPPCCNPEHLSIGTRIDNMRDMAQKGRQGRRLGEASRNARLTEADVYEIRASPESQNALGLRFGVAPSTIWGIRHRRSWAHLA